MYVRLAFAVAAYLESEILIVDEVLAVGDAEFQKKCLGKMGEVSKGEGKTVLFVSHNLTAIQQLCNICLFLDTGRLIEQNDTHKILSSYLRKAQNTYYHSGDIKKNQSVYINKASIDNRILSDGSIEIELEIGSNIDTALSVDFRIYSGMSIPVGFSSIGTLKYDELVLIKVGYEKFVFKIDISVLAIGEYVISIDLTEPNIQYYDRCDDCLSFEILKTEANDRHLDQSWNYGFVNLPISILQ
jgi:lipopolysaccharide transport system ATP-binding protein